MRVVPCMNYDDWAKRGRPAGAVWYYTAEGSEAPAGMHIVCPCGCGGLWGASFPRWTLDGDRDAPTLSPSLRFLEPTSDGSHATHWHGFIRNGVFETCSDSPHRPKGEA